jgi:hypothetical protein
MSLFAKKPEAPPMQVPPTKSVARGKKEPAAKGPAYGVADLIALIKSIPIDHHPDLVVQVVKTTLESVGVHVADIMDDAARLETDVKERIAAIEGEIGGLAQEIDRRRDLITQLRSDVADLTFAKERWQKAETPMFAAPPPKAASEPKSHPPLPLPPPFHKSSP